jgi:ATP-dependent Clp protease ATP-binding subunit ClpA
MFERYTEKARRGIFFARYEASQFGSTYIQTEHLLLGLTREAKGSLDTFLPDPQKRAVLRARIEGHTTPREKVPTSVDLPLSDDCKQILSYAAEEAEKLHHKHIGTEHLLLGILREEGSYAAQLMRECGASLEDARKTLAETQPQVESQRGQPTMAGTSLPLDMAEELLYGFARQMDISAEAAPPEFERFTPLAKPAVFLAKYEAKADFKEAVETQHFLRALLRAPSGDLYRFLPPSLSWKSLPSHWKSRPRYSVHSTEVAQLPFSDECKQAIAYALEEARQLGHGKIGVEHLFLGLLRTTDSEAARFMREHGADLHGLREKLRASVPPDPAQPD